MGTETPFRIFLSRIFLSTQICTEGNEAHSRRIAIMKLKACPPTEDHGTLSPSEGEGRVRGRVKSIPIQ